MTILLLYENNFREEQLSKISDSCAIHQCYHKQSLYKVNNIGCVLTASVVLYPVLLQRVLLKIDHTSTTSATAAHTVSEFFC